MTSTMRFQRLQSLYVALLDVTTVITALLWIAAFIYTRNFLCFPFALGGGVLLIALAKGKRKS